MPRCGLYDRHLWAGRMCEQGRPSGSGGSLRGDRGSLRGVDWQVMRTGVRRVYETSPGDTWLNSSGQLGQVYGCVGHAGRQGDACKQWMTRSSLASHIQQGSNDLSCSLPSACEVSCSHVDIMP